MKRDLTLLQARTSLNCSNPTAWKLINEGKLTVYRVGRQVRVTQEALDEYKKKHGIVPRANKA